MVPFASGFGPRASTPHPSSLPPVVAVTLLAVAIAGTPSATACQPVSGDAVGSTRMASRVDARRSAGAEVRVEIPAVMRVRPDSPVEVELTPGGNGTDTARLVVECVGNVRHTVEIRGLAGHGGVRWTTPGSSWERLGSRPRTVAEDLPPGRHPRCGVIRFRRPASERHSGTEGAEPGPVVVALEVHRAR